MATSNYFEDELPESDEVFFPMATMVDDGSIYHDLISLETLSEDSDNDDEREIQVYSRPQPSLPPTVDGHIFNLVQIVDDHRPDPQSPFLRTHPSNGLMKVVIDLGGANGPLSKIWRSSCDQTYFQKWYLDQRQRSASVIDHSSMIHSDSRTTQKTNDDFRLTSPSPSSSSSSSDLPMAETADDEQLRSEIQRIYGFDDVETESTVSSRRSSISDKPPEPAPRPPKSPVILNVVSHHRVYPSITVREYYPSVDRSISNSSFNTESTRTENDERLLSDYEEVLRQHPDVYQDPNPEIINESNLNPVTYRQNVTVRYLVPPTPPPPGALIIRETIPPPAPSPPPLVITQQDPSPATPSPIILREAPPTPPLQQEPTIINKFVTSQSASVVEQEASLPPKPQSIIIEKWLPYKPAPPREVIYERLVEEPMVTQFQPPRHLTEFDPLGPSERVDRIPIPVHREDSSNDVPPPAPSLFDQIARTTQEQIEALERRTREQIHAHQRWMENQWEQHSRLFMPMLPVLTTPALVVNHPPIVRSTNATYAHEASFQEHVYIEPSYLYPFYT